ncbi:hypothetical protein BH11MYX1_BH11MYX1_23990 [soil metagenome]
MDAKQELSDELRKARNWILGVGILMFVIDTIMIQGVYANRLPSEWKTKLLIVDLVILGVFVGLYVLARSQPKLACVLALVAYWGLQLGVAAWTGSVTSLFTQGIVIKIMFTMALVRGLKSANRAVLLQSELERVFG